MGKSFTRPGDFARDTGGKIYGVRMRDVKSWVAESLRRKKLARLPPP